MINLSVASPFAASELSILGSYFELLQSEVSTLDSEQMQGDQISLEWLRSYETNIRLHPVPLSIQEGLSDEISRTWTAAANWPDIALTRSLPDQNSANPFADLTSLLIDDPNLAADQVMANIIRISQRQDGWYGIPWRVTVPVLYFNRQILQDNGFDSPTEELTWDEFTDLTGQLTQKLKRENRLLNAATVNRLTIDAGGQNQISAEANLVLANAEDILSFWPAAQTEDLRWATWDGQQFNFDDPSFTDGVLAVRELVRDGQTMLPINATTLDSIASVDQLIKNNQVAFWIDDSDSLSEIHSSDPGPVGYTWLPLAQSDQPMRYPLELLTFSVSKASSQVLHAASFAAFLSVDPDSILLQTRLLPLNGYFPVVRDLRVWQSIQELTTPAYTDSLDFIPEHLSNGYIGGQYEIPAWPDVLNQTINAYSEKLLTSSDPLPVISQLQVRANQMTR